MSAPRTENIYWHASAVTPEDRERVLNQRGCVLWLTGLSGSGKSTIAQGLERALIDAGYAAYILDGDNIRHGLNAGLGFSVEDRRENLRRIAEVSRLFADAGLICLSAFISPLRETRDRARELVGAGRFFEVYVATSLEECERRDTKGLYRKARAGEVEEFTGISSPYEEPENPEIRVETTGRSVDDCVTELMDALRDRDILLGEP